jgi:hypothetical protein
MKSGLGCAVSRGYRQRHKGQAGGNIDDGGMLLRLQVREKRCGSPDRAQQVRRDDRFRVRQAIG